LANRLVPTRKLSLAFHILVIGAAAAAPLRGQQQSAQSTMTVSAYVQPSCIVRTAPAETGRVAVELTCAKNDLNRVRVGQGRLQVPRDSGTARTTVVSGSLVQIDF
jgi:hypothetical protein